MKTRAQQKKWVKQRRRANERRKKNNMKRNYAGRGLTLKGKRRAALWATDPVAKRLRRLGGCGHI